MALPQKEDPYTPPYTLLFKKLLKNDVGRAGGKGANLGELTRAGISVPPGFVVLRQAFDRFLEETDIDIEVDKWLHKLNHRNTASIDRASHELRDAIRRVDFPEDIGREITEQFEKMKAKRVAVRSSATAEDSKIASWAGELETYLFVTERNLLKKVKECWSSLYTPRALFYRFEKKLHRQRVSVAVVIQQMIDADVSGITFTAHPVTRDRQQMVIEAGYGLGEAIVSGLITPDTYIYDRVSRTVLDINVSEQKKMIVRKVSCGTKTVAVPKSDVDKQKMKQKKIIELARLCEKIEKHYRSPQDIEWAIAHNKIYITQTRPITTL